LNDVSDPADFIGAGKRQVVRQGRGPVRLTRIIVALGWLVVGALGLVALLRLVAWDSLEPLIVLNALTLIVYLPAWVIAIAAAVARKWWLTAAALLICAAQVAFAAPEFLAASPVPSWTHRAVTLTVFDANIDKSFQFETGYVQAIARDHPELVTLEEFTPSALLAMVASGVLEAYPYRCVAPALGATGFLVASKLPLRGCQTKTVPWDGMPTPYMVEATLSTAAGPIALRLVHTLAPLPAYWHEWSSALAAVDQVTRPGSDARTLMIGDFNATWGNAGFVALVHSGLTDAAAARGKALDMTWPNGALVPTFVRIDHVLTGSQLAVTAIDSGPGFGSDHRYVTAKVAIRG
jgi:endonuclease/exonuclease/phosphatase (EEP) superfamily protein YafD